MYQKTQKKGPFGLFSRRILEENEPDYYSGKFFFLFFSSDHRMYA